MFNDCHELRAKQHPILDKNPDAFSLDESIASRLKRSRLLCAHYIDDVLFTS